LDNAHQCGFDKSLYCDENEKLANGILSPAEKYILTFDDGIRGGISLHDDLETIFGIYIDRPAEDSKILINFHEDGSVWSIKKDQYGKEIFFEEYEKGKKYDVPGIDLKSERNRMARIITAAAAELPPLPNHFKTAKILKTMSAME
jgi:hypothetical protein